MSPCSANDAGRAFRRDPHPNAWFFKPRLNKIGTSPTLVQPWFEKPRVFRAQWAAPGIRGVRGVFWGVPPGVEIPGRGGTVPGAVLIVPVSSPAAGVPASLAGMSPAPAAAGAAAPSFGAAGVA